MRFMAAFGPYLRRSLFVEAAFPKISHYMVQEHEFELYYLWKGHGEKESLNLNL
jgi:hypothetical protein